MLSLIASLVLTQIFNFGVVTTWHLSEMFFNYTRPNLRTQKPRRRGKKGMEKGKRKEKEEEMSIPTSSITSGESTTEGKVGVFCCANQGISYLPTHSTYQSASNSHAEQPTANSTILTLFITALRSLRDRGEPGLLITPLFSMQEFHQSTILQPKTAPQTPSIATATRLIQIQTVHPASAFYGIGKEYRFHYFLLLSEGIISTYHQMYPEEAFTFISEQAAQLYIEASGNPWVLEEKSTNEIEEVSWVCEGCDWSYWVRVLDLSPPIEGLAGGPQDDTVEYSGEHGKLYDSRTLDSIEESGEVSDEASMANPELISRNSAKLTKERIVVDTDEKFSSDEYVEVSKEEIERDVERDVEEWLDGAVVLDKHEVEEEALGHVVKGRLWERGWRGGRR